METSKKTVFAPAALYLAAAFTLTALIASCKTLAPAAPAPAPQPASTSQVTVKQSPAEPFPAPQFHEISITRKEYMPGAITVPPRSTVTWVNRSDEQHSVISVDKLFNVPIPIGGSFSYSFNDSGTYSYYCEVWPEMAGTVYVK